MSDSAAIVAATTSVSGAIDAVANAPESISMLFRLAERLVYGTGYTAAYAVVFPLAVVYAAIPKRNALLQGIINGSHDAKSKAQAIVG